MRLALLLTVLSGLSCGDGTRPGEGPAPEGVRAPVRGGEAVIASIVDVESFNPAFARSTFTNDVLRRLFLPLLLEQPDFADHPPSYEPALALSHEFSPDRLTLEFRLRPGAVWSDGTPITARDVAFTHEALTSPEVAWAGVRIKDRIASVRAVDDETVEFRFREDAPSNLRDAIEGLVMPSHAFGKVPFAEWRTKDFSRDLVVDGPFSLAAHRKNEEIVLERNPRYHDAPRPYLDRVVFRILASQSQAIEHVLGGHVDVVEAVPPDAAERIRADRRLDLVVYPNRQIDYVAWNEIEPGAWTLLRGSLEKEGRTPTIEDLKRLKASSPHPLFADARVRRALSLAIDRVDVVDSLWLGFAHPSLGPVHSSLWPCDRALPPFPHDVARARALLADAGFRDLDGDGILDRGGRAFSFALVTNVENKLRERIALKLKDQLAKVGVDVRFEPYEDAYVRKLLSDKNFDARLGAWRVSTKPEVRSSYHSASALSGQNLVAYTNARVDEIVEALETARDPEASDALWREVQSILRDDEPYALLYEPLRLNAVARRFRGVRMNALETYFKLEEWWVADGTSRGR